MDTSEGRVDRAVDEREVDAALETMSWDSLGPAALGLGALFALFAVAHLFTPAAGGRALTCGLAVATSVALGLFAWAWQRGRIARGHSQAWSAAIALVVLANALVRLSASQDLWQSTYLVLFVVGAGALLVSTATFSVVIVATLLGWAATVWGLASGGHHPAFAAELSHFGFGIGAATATSIVVHVVRVRQLRRLERLGIGNALHARTMEEAARAAESATKAKSGFLAAMSHEIRTPMNGLIGMTHLLLETELDAEQRDFANTIRSCGESLHMLLNDILDFSKIEAGRLALEEVDFELQETVEEVSELLAITARQKKIELSCFVSPALPTMVAGDPGRIRQVLTNLLGNAIKFTEHGAVSYTHLTLPTILRV